MITHRCDVCNEDITERFVVVIDNKEHDLCKSCKAKTIGKVKNGRAVAQPIQYVPWYVQPYYDYSKPNWVSPITVPYQLPTVWCNENNLPDGSYTITTTGKPLDVKSTGSSYAISPSNFQISTTDGPSKYAVSNCGGTPPLFTSEQLYALGKDVN